MEGNGYREKERDEKSKVLVLLLPSFTAGLAPEGPDNRPIILVGSMELSRQCKVTAEVMYFSLLPLTNSTGRGGRGPGQPDSPMLLPTWAKDALPFALASSKRLILLFYDFLTGPCEKKKYRVIAHVSHLVSPSPASISSIINLYLHNTTAASSSYVPCGGFLCLSGLP